MNVAEWFIWWAENDCRMFSLKGIPHGKCAMRYPGARPGNPIFRPPQPIKSATNRLSSPLMHFAAVNSSNLPV